jgi:hypothetical protein
VRIAGIDPGLEGGIAIGGYVYDMPTRERSNGKREVDFQRIARLFCAAVAPDPVEAFTNSMFVYIERASAMPAQGRTQGTAGMFNYGMGYGGILGVLEAFGIPYCEVQPRSWKAHFGLGPEKVHAVELAERLFPSQTLRTPRGRLLHGRAEALLIALYGEETHAH